MTIEPKRAYKIVLIGDPEVGKTSIRRKYMGKSFRADYLKTLGADFAAQKVNIDGESVLLTIWDLAGQTIFHGMRSSFYHGCKCALVVFDVTNPASLEHSFKWAEEATNYAKNSLQELYLIGNKIDLVENRLVYAEEINKVANEFEKTFNFPVRVYETSALTGENINELFDHMSRKLIIGDLSEKEKEQVSGEKLKSELGSVNGVSSKTNNYSSILKLVNDLEKNVRSLTDKIIKLKEALKDIK
ncbi:MAG: Rab family GTPase [Candidatus Heimdallarchaeaceae archaeon]